VWRQQTKEETKSASEHSSPTYLSSTSSITGELLFQNPARIDGRVDGEIVALSDLTIGETAEITARIDAPSVVVFGGVTGDIKAKRIEIRAPARVVGNLISPILVVAEGSVLNCRCFMSEPPPKEQGSQEAEVIVLDSAVGNGGDDAPQQGVSFFITKGQRADLRARGYNDAAIDKMTPGDAHKILGLI